MRAGWPWFLQPYNHWKRCKRFSIFLNLTRPWNMDRGTLRNGGLVMMAVKSLSKFLLNSRHLLHYFIKLLGARMSFFPFFLFFFYTWRRIQTIPPVHIYCLYTTYFIHSDCALTSEIRAEQVVMLVSIINMFDVTDHIATGYFRHKIFSYNKR